MVVKRFRVTFSGGGGEQSDVDEWRIRIEATTNRRVWQAWYSSTSKHEISTFDSF